MANLKSAKKRAIQNKKRQARNQARRTELKTLTKKYLDALDNNDITLARELMRETESKLARAKGKGVVKKETAQRKISKLTKKLATASSSR